MQYYKYIGHVECHPEYEPVDIGWRFCVNELPEKEGHYVVAEQNPKTKEIYRLDDLWQYDFEKGWFFELDHFYERDGKKGFNIVQWCKLPEPLKEGE